MRRMRFPAILLVVLIVSVACATITLTKTANTLSALGTQFLETGQMIDDAYKAKLVSEADYQKWRDFVPGFKLSFSQAEQALRTLRDAGTVETPEQQAALVLKLKNQLLSILMQVYAPAAQKVS